MEEVLNRSGRREKGSRRLPAHVMIRYVIAMGLRPLVVPRTAEPADSGPPTTLLSSTQTWQPVRVVSTPRASPAADLTLRTGEATARWRWLT
nr:transposase domain-containing protein [Krasilnikovia cinnamomea]